MPYIHQSGHQTYCPTLAGLGERRLELNKSIGLNTHIRDISDYIDIIAEPNLVMVGHINDNVKNISFKNNKIT